MSIFAEYAVNNTNAEVQMIDNKIKIPGNGWRGVTSEELKHPDIIYALRMEWITLVKKEPTGEASPPRRKPVISNPQEYRGDKEPQEAKVKVSKIGG